MRDADRLPGSYTSALQTIALFGLKLHRFPAMMGASVFFVL